MTTGRDYYILLTELENGGDHWDAADVVGRADGPAVPRRCMDCGRPAYYDTTDEWYHHATDAATGCFLIGPEDRPDDMEHPLLARWAKTRAATASFTTCPLIRRNGKRDGGI